MLIRRPAAEVFDAIVNPDITTKFWFTRSSGRLTVGPPVRWDWEMYDSARSERYVAVANPRRSPASMMTEADRNLPARRGSNMT